MLHLRVLVPTLQLPRMSCSNVVIHWKWALIRVQTNHAGIFLCRVVLTFDLLNAKYVGFQDSLWNISMSSLVMLSAAAFVISCRKTDRQTYRQMPMKVLAP